MAEAIKSLNASMAAASAKDEQRSFIVNYLPALLPLLGAFLVVAARIKFGASAVPADGPLVILAVLSYLIAASSLLTNLWAPIGFLQRLGMWTLSLGFFFNFSSWLVRWVTAGERENWVRMTNQITGEYHFWWFFSYIPYANLYDLSVAFAFGAGFATLLVSQRENSRFIGAVSTPLISLILLMAVFIGSEFIQLPPVLDSYWRPIHVGVASMSYGVALVSFAMAVMYLVKDGVKMEAMAMVVAAATLGTYVFVWLMGGIKGLDPFSLSFRLNPGVPHANGFSNSGARVALPGVGIIATLSLVLFFAAAVCFALYLYKNKEAARGYGHWLLRASIVAQIATIGMVFYRIKTMGVVGSLIGNDQSYAIGKHLMGKEAAGRSVEELVSVGSNFLATNRDSLVLSIKGNPVEIAALITLLVVTCFLAIFSFRTEKIRESLPSLERIDSLIYKLVGVAFAGLAILLVTGAVWANESWGRYWGWDAKETGALVAWFAYGGYLHSRISHGWAGRRSVYFALVGFLLVVFTYLGVSYILPGLHSYA
ncbi:MAG TPA: cytochrome c biogenesis protein CcsA [Blastocatellia bacterium]|nr:cytochrome c biogenesis protein CcsA [Blastocatellia bacterium]HMX28324.1 cytochrome c biogenesis protein CcsA [Blastocatellia bacterium]HMZ20622.1 cytochrome c biogenesis protein CcsA [Blastocatellia bacterium]HNG28404.1 cytochrome c biogenesis protein CcsA [Blastocatellia bacterium]